MGSKFGLISLWFLLNDSVQCMCYFLSILKCFARGVKSQFRKKIRYFQEPINFKRLVLKLVAVAYERFQMQGFDLEIFDILEN